MTAIASRRSGITHTHTLPTRLQWQVAGQGSHTHKPCLPDCNGKSPVRDHTHTNPAYQTALASRRSGITHKQTLPTRLQWQVAGQGSHTNKPCLPDCNGKSPVRDHTHTNPAYQTATASRRSGITHTQTLPTRLHWQVAGQGSHTHIPCLPDCNGKSPVRDHTQTNPAYQTATASRRSGITHTYPAYQTATASRRSGITHTYPAYQTAMASRRSGITHTHTLPTRQQRQVAGQGSHTHKPCLPDCIGKSPVRDHTHTYPAYQTAMASRRSGITHKQTLPTRLQRQVAGQGSHTHTLPTRLQRQVAGQGSHTHTLPTRLQRQVASQGSHTHIPCLPDCNGKSPVRDHTHTYPAYQTAMASRRSGITHTQTLPTRLQWQVAGQGSHTHTQTQTLPVHYILHLSNILIQKKCWCLRYTLTLGYL